MGGITIKNPGNGQQALVSTDGQLFTLAENLSLQHYISRYRGQMYQVQFFDTGVASGTNVIGHITNNSPTLSLVVAYIRVQCTGLTGGTALGDNAANYFTANFDEVYSSGGSAVTPVNLNRKSGNTADVTAYDTNPTLTGTPVEFDRVYMKDSAQQTFRKEGSLILGSGDSMSIKFVTDNSGTAYSRLSFMMMDLR